MRLKLLMVINPTANNGKSKQTWQKVKQYLDQQNINYDYRVSNYKGHIQLITEQLIKNNLTTPNTQLVMVVLGGDGSLNEVLTSIGNLNRDSHSQIPIGLIPAGQDNNFAVARHINLEWQSALDQIIKCQKPKMIPIGQYSDQGTHTNHYFLNHLEIGLGSDFLNELKTNQSKFKMIRWIKTLLAIIITLYNLEIFSLRLNIKGHSLYFGRTVEILIQNTPLLNKNLKIIKKESIPSNQFRIIILEKRNILTLILLLMGIIMGKKPKSKWIHYYYADRIELNDSTLKYGNIDGSVIGSKFFDIHCKLIKYPFWI